MKSACLLANCCMALICSSAEPLSSVGDRPPTASARVRLLVARATMTRSPPSRARRTHSHHIFWCVMSFQAGQSWNRGQP